MSRDFISIHAMQGELKLSHKKRGCGLTVTTKELIIQKPHTNYYLKLDDMISILPVEPYGSKPLRYVADWTEGSQMADVAPGVRHYRIMLRSATLHNRSGLRQLRSCDFILPIDDSILRAIAVWSGLSPVSEGTSPQDEGGAGGN